MNISIRKAVNDDIKQLSEMLAELFSIEDDFEINAVKQVKALEMIINNTIGNVILIAEADSKIAGMVNLQKVVSTAAGGFSILLEDLFVMPEYRKKGIGKKLIDQAARWGRKQGALRIQLAAHQGNMDGEIFYTGRGFIKSSMIFYYKYI